LRAGDRSGFLRLEQLRRLQTDRQLLVAASLRLANLAIEVDLLRTPRTTVSAALKPLLRFSGRGEQRKEFIGIGRQLLARLTTKTLRLGGGETLLVSNLGAPPSEPLLRKLLLESSQPLRELLHVGLALVGLRHTERFAKLRELLFQRLSRLPLLLELLNGDALLLAKVLDQIPRLLRVEIRRIAPRRRLPVRRLSRRLLVVLHVARGVGFLFHCFSISESTQPHLAAGTSKSSSRTGGASSTPHHGYARADRSHPASTGPRRHA